MSNRGYSAFWICFAFVVMLFDVVTGADNQSFFVGAIVMSTIYAMWSDLESRIGK